MPPAQLDGVALAALGNQRPEVMPRATHHIQEMIEIISTLLANGVPTLGNAGFELHASNVGGAPVLLMGDAEDAAGSILFNVRFHLDFDPLPPAVGLVLQASLSAPDAHGSLVVPLPIPSTPGLVGRTFVLQVASAFPTGTCSRRLTTTRGLRLTIQ